MISRRFVRQMTSRQIVLVRSYSSEESVPFYKRIFKRNAQADLAAIEAEIAQKAEIQMQSEMEAEAREREIDTAKRRSRLFYSDRLLIKDQMPQAGIEWEKNDEHKSREFKAMMLARFGAKTKIDPSVAWPTDEEVEEQKEYEKVLYDGLTLPELIKKAQEESKEREEAILKREKEIAAKMAKQEEQLKAWQKRVESRNVFADREKQKREQILLELREEFGYDINPNDPQFAEKIAEKEKAISKAKKAEKKLQQQQFIESKKAQTSS